MVEQVYRYANYFINNIVAAEEVAVDLGFALLRDKKRKRTGITQGKPNFVKLVQRQLDEEGLYRVLSGLAYSDTVFLMQLTSAPIDDAKCNGDVVMERAIHHDKLDTLLAEAAAVYARGAWLKTIQFHGDSAQTFDLVNIRTNVILSQASLVVHGANFPQIWDGRVLRKRTVHFLKYGLTFISILVYVQYHYLCGWCSARRPLTFDRRK